MGMELPVEISPVLIDYVRKKYTLHWEGIHGWNHWVRVYENGQHLARQNGADLLVVSLFAFTHDMARLNDSFDPRHGPRAAARIVKDLQGKIIQLSPQQLAWLVKAVKLHTFGMTKADLTVMTCWDSDRLDLGRVGILPEPDRLCTPAAKDPATIAWAIKRSQGG
jgi:uncharacterized protein